MDAVASVLVANAVLATVAAMLVAGVCGLVRRPAVANRAWLLVLLKLVTPPMAGMSVAWLVAPTPPVTVPPVVSAPPPLSTPDPLPAEPVDLPAADPLPAGEPLGASPAPVEPIMEPHQPTPATPWVWPTLLAVWAGGAVGWWAVVAGRVARFRRTLRVAGTTSPDLTAAVAAVAGRFGLRRPPTAVLVEAPVSPLVWAGFGRPVLVFPARLWGALSADQRDAVLAHELAHLARGDHWVRRLEVVVLGVYWWLPTAWLAVRALRRAEEVCCDAWAVGADPGRAAGYADALVEAVAMLSGPEPVPLASGGAARLGELNRRVTMILTDRPNPRLGVVARVLVLAAAVGLLPWGVTLADDPPPAAEPPPIPDVRPQPTPRANPSPLSAAVIPTEEIERLKEEVELLAVQLDIKRAHVAAAEASATNLRRSFDSIRKSSGAALSQAELFEKEAAVQAAEGQLMVRKAELREHELRLSHAKRRLDRLTGGRPASAQPSAVRRPLDFGTVAGGVTKSMAVRFPNPLPRAAQPTALVPDEMRGVVEIQFKPLTVAAGQEGTAVVVVRGSGKPAALQAPVRIVDGNDTLMVLDLSMSLTPARPQADPTALNTLQFRRELAASRQQADALAKQVADLTAEVRRMRGEREQLTALVQRLEKQLEQATQKK